MVTFGGTMRLGAYDCAEEGSLAGDLYGQTNHRRTSSASRYEVNINYRDALEKEGLNFSGISPDGSLPEIVERSDLIRFLSAFSSIPALLKIKPFDPHPFFRGFISAARDRSRLV